MKIYAIGIGPGDSAQMTPRAAAAVAACDVVMGYQTYLSLIPELLNGKHVESTGMRQEVIRCQKALDYARKGHTVAMICSGDAGIYGMAGLLYTVCQAHPEVELEVIPGITAVNSAAALLGAPLMHDFAVVSLSDLLTPWDTIERRLHAAGSADFVLCLYNPGSRSRTEQLPRACEILLQYRKSDTPCGIASDIGRSGESTQICTLKVLQGIAVQMTSTVLIGNSQTGIINGKLVTPRGYGGACE